MRDQFTRRLDALDKKESYLLDLAAEEGWPKDKLREKIAAIRTERRDIEHNLTETERQLDTGANTFRKALDLLGNPAQMYTEGDETVRSILNKALFSKFVIDGTKIVDAELKEPFDALTAASERDEVRVYLRKAGRLSERASGTRGGRGRGKPSQLATCPALATESGAPADDLSLTDQLELALALLGQGFW